MNWLTWSLIHVLVSYTGNAIATAKRFYNNIQDIYMLATPSCD